MSEISSEERDVRRRQLRKKSELSLGIPVIGLCLLVSPLLNSFTTDGDHTPYADIMIYVFGVWGALILAAFIMARALSNDVEE